MENCAQKDEFLYRKRLRQNWMAGNFEVGAD
jgi:hypothetical protein